MTKVSARATPGRRRLLILLEGGTVVGAPGAAGYSGFIRYIAGATPILQEAGMSVTFGTVRARGPLHDAMEELGCETFALDARTSRSYGRATWRLARRLRRDDIQLLHLHEPIQATIGAAASKLARRGTTIFHRHHIVIPGPMIHLTKLASRMCDGTIAVSRAVVAQAVADTGTPPDEICLAFNGVPAPRPVDAQEVADLRAELGIPRDAPVIVVVGHVYRAKGHRTLVEALRIVSAQRNDVHLVVVGRGPDLEEVRARARQVLGEAAHLVGHQSDVAPWFALADVVAVPSYQEAFGLVATEAMASSKPVVASGVGGLREIVVDGVTGTLVPAGDPVALARGLTTMLEDDPLRQRLGRAGRARYLEVFTVEAMVARWLECYEEALGSSRRRGLRPSP